MTMEASTEYKKLKLPIPSDIPLKDYLPVNSGEVDPRRPISSNTTGEESEDDKEETTDPKSQLLDSPPFYGLPKQASSKFTRRNTVIMLTSAFVLILGLVALVRASWFERRATSSECDCASTTTVPQYFQTTPEIFAGPTATGRAPFLAASNPAPFGPAGTFVANAPLETALPIVGNTQNQSIFHLVGQLSPYFPNPTLVFSFRMMDKPVLTTDRCCSGFGVDELPLPAGSNITQFHMIHRHGSRYPTTDSNVVTFGRGLAEIISKGNTNFTGDLSFVNSWSYGLGAEILVPVGRQELFDSGVLHYYNYGHLYNTSTKIIARTTTQDRMLKSAENFMAGFFGLSWTQNATLEPIIEGDYFNNSLAGYDNCNNSNKAVAAGGTNASAEWQGVYLVNATSRLQAMSGDSYKWNTSSTYAAQTICPYETVAFGYSAWCDLFTYEEWLGFEYSIDLSFAGNNYFQSPTGRAVGIGYVEEVLARLNQHLLTSATAQDNITLDNNTTTFPLNQTLYFDFSHDTNIAAVLTAFGLTQFAPVLPAKGPIPQNQQLIVSHLQPFGARLDIEIITAPQPVSATRGYDSDEYEEGGPTTYVHFIINQRTLPLGKSLSDCGQRTDGWCEVGTFLKVQEGMLAKAKYDESCNGDYAVVPYGGITDGVPIS